ncbi:MAG: hydroxyethylthiazole kinase [Faecalicatena sp.]|uniref:hydroxyethylthiazole kinase n=1 Tax=Faecalicatena sp. TaxID=2005360 RepID=UPI00258FC5CC|nr:hydroxyethylthiazole kinase [Faecalicatena sp.]MCI6466516.1 hydroxyethylthiazole kinase [Faecalicatena sp.]MDY5617891.1 hydroxyethylthiazole kinase [Lachnospiraceae bacterium]
MIHFKEAMAGIRKEAPLVQCITNFVTVNDCANIILAAGGSPSMAHDIREVEEAVEGVQALVCNMGAIEDTEAMVLAGKRANQLGKPVVLDPVAAGGTQLRRDAAARLLHEVHFSVIRGNASEIRSLAGGQAAGSGVDVSVSDVITEDNLMENIELVRQFAQRIKTVIAVSGKMDVISDGTRTVVIHNGCPMMSRITGSGCMLTSLIGAFCGALPGDPFTAAVTATAAMGVCGEIAEQQRLQKGTGNATFRTDLIDAVFNLTEEQLVEGIRYEIYEG